MEAGVFPQAVNSLLFLLVPGLIKKFCCLAWRQNVIVLNEVSLAATSISFLPVQMFPLNPRL